VEAAAVEQKNLVLRPRVGAGERVYWDAQWRYRSNRTEAWRLKKQRLGLAWLEDDGQGGWRRRRGRCRAGWLDERAATVRGLAEDWLHWLERVRGAKPSTVRDYGTLLREPGERHRRRSGRERVPDRPARGERADQALSRLPRPEPATLIEAMRSHYQAGRNLHALLDL
jgi:hypothetical protein